MSGPLFWRKTTVLAEVETTYGTDAAPTGAHAIRIKDASCVPLDGQVIDRGYVRGFMGASEKTHVGIHRSSKFACELSGSGTAGIVPGYSPLLRCVGLGETIRPAASTVQASPGTPAAGNVGTLTYTMDTTYAGTVDRVVTITCTTAGASGAAKVTVAAPAVDGVAAYNVTDVTVTDATPLALPGGAAIVPTVGTALAVGDSWTIALGAALTRYTPVSDDFEAGSIYFFKDGILYRQRGTRGNATLSFMEKDVPKISFDTKGLWERPLDQSPPTPAPAGFTKGLVLSKDNTPVASLFGVDIVLTSLEVNLGNSFEYKDRPNQAEVILARPGTTASIKFRYPKLADWDVEMAAHDDLTGALRIVHGTAAGNVVDLSALRVQITEPKQEQDGEEVACSATLTLLPSDAGNDDFTLTAR
jgi:hypothetical protein